jgi:hypothetical protein
MFGHKSAEEFWEAQGTLVQPENKVVLSEKAYEAFQARLSAEPIFRPRLSALVSLSKELEDESN